MPRGEAGVSKASEDAEDDEVGDTGKVTEGDVQPTKSRHSAKPRTFIFKL